MRKMIILSLIIIIILGSTFNVSAGIFGFFDKNSANPGEMVDIQAGTTSEENGNLTLEYDIEIGKYEVTHKEFIKFLNNEEEIEKDESWLTYRGTRIIFINYNSAIKYDEGNFHFGGSSYADSENCPVILVTWHGALAYCNWLSKKEGLTPAYDLNNLWEIKDSPEHVEGYRLPTADEWQYVALGGSNGEKTNYAGSDNLDEVAWNVGNSAYKTHAIGGKKPNELGIYDMSGNVEEWTNTRYYDEDGWLYIFVRDGLLDREQKVRLSDFDRAISKEVNRGFRIVRTK